MIHFHNASSQNYTGWVHATISREEADALRAAGKTRGVSLDMPLSWTLGHDLGLFAVGIDLYFRDLASGQTGSVDLSHGSVWEEGATLEWIDPKPQIMGAAFNLLSKVRNGAHHLCHYRLKVGMLVADLWLRVYQNQNFGVMTVTASDSSKVDLGVQIPFDISPWFRAGEWIADGQRRSYLVEVRGTLVYNRQDNALPFARGIEAIGPTGQVAQRGGLDVPRWISRHRDAAYLSQFNWNALQIGVTANSTVTGDQEDQGFMQCFEPFYEGGLPAIGIRHLAALCQGKRPCHHLDHNGDPIDPEREATRVVYWEGRPHWHRSVSPNQFNKPRALSPSQCNGWWGPDNQHWLLNTVAGALELTDCPALQDELEHQAYLYLGSETLDPSLSTSAPRTARGFGWTSLVAAHLYRLLIDRTLANRVKQRWIARWGIQKQALNDGLWDVRPTAGSHFASLIKTPKFFMPYQVAVGAYGCYVAGEVFGMGEARSAAYRAAQRVRDCYDSNGTEWDVVGVDEQGLLVRSFIEGTTAHRTGWYRFAWMPLIWYVLDDQIKAREVLDDYLQGTPSPDRTADWIPIP